jgi:hypothetical protein
MPIFRTLALRSFAALGLTTLAVVGCSSSGASDDGESATGAGASSNVGPGGTNGTGGATGGTANGGAGSGGTSAKGGAGQSGNAGGAAGQSAGNGGGAGSTGGNGGASGGASLGGSGGANGGVSGSSTTGGSGGASGTGGNGGTGVTFGAGGSSAGAGGDTSGGNGGGGGSAPSALVYAHTDTVLFQLDPTSPSLALTQIGTFDCVGGSGQDSAMTDLAVDKQQNLWAISDKNVYPLTVQGTTVHCVQTIALSNTKGVNFYGLTFAPVGVLDPAAEVLVAGNTAGELWSIDASGAGTQRGTFGTVPAADPQGNKYANAGKEWELSGDIVFFANNGDPVGFATVRDCPTPPSTSNCNATNTLLEIDVAKLATSQPTDSVTKAVRGQIKKAATCTDSTNGDYGNMYGIAAWESKVYGFSRTGNLVEMSVEDGTACLVQAYAADKFAGAGVTTIAPVVKP